MNRKMRTLVVIVAAALCLAVPRCAKNANPDTPPPPEGPVISKVGVNCAFKVTASDPDLDRVSVRMDWNNGDTSDWSEVIGSGDSATLVYVWSGPGNYRVSAQAKDEKGAVSGWSNWHSITVSDTVNVPPEMPSTPAGTDTGFVGSEYDFTALADDQNGDRVHLQFDWGDGDTSDWSALVSGGTQVTMSHAWPTTGEYSIVARAMDGKGLVSAWSNVHIFVAVWDTVSRAPGIPLIPAGPDTAYVDSTCDFSTAGGDPNGDSIMFQFDWGDGDTSSWSSPVAESTVVSLGHSWTTAGQFSVRARAKDRSDLTSEWSWPHILTVTSSRK